VSGTSKKRLLNNRSGALLITPESLEALFVVRGQQIPTLFAGLRYVVIDELHSFLGSERGAQLRSLLHRLELALRRRVPRVGPSATPGDTRLAAEQLRPGGGDAVHTIVSKEGGQELQMQLRGYLRASGRRGEPAVLRGYVIEAAVDKRTPLPDALRAQLFQSVAMTELLSEGWCEPPEPAALHLSTLTEQLLSLIAQHGGATPAQAYAALCSGSSPFQAVTKAMFDDLLRTGARPHPRPHAGAVRGRADAGVPRQDCSRDARSGPGDVRQVSSTRRTPSATARTCTCCRGLGTRSSTRSRCGSPPRAWRSRVTGCA
jgi:hypothetical protein